MLLIVLEVYFSLLFSNKADFRVCFVARKIWSPLFFMSIPGTSVPNDRCIFQLTFKCIERYGKVVHLDQLHTYMKAF